MKKLVALALVMGLAACNPQSASEIAEADAKAEAEAFAKENAGMIAATGKNLETGKAWMTENAKVTGVVALPSGVQYRQVKAGPAGGKSPGPEDEVTVHYEGRLIDGKVFDSSYERGEPATFRLSMVIPGWSEAVQKMVPGDQFEVAIPPNLAYGPMPKGEIPGNSTLIFKLELIRVLPATGQG